MFPLNDGALFLILVFTVSVGVYCVLSSRGKQRAVQDKRALSERQEAKIRRAELKRCSWPKLTEKPYTSISKRLGIDLDIPEWHSSWSFPQQDLGCFIFTATKPGGLVIGLATTMNPDTLHDAEGYGIVIDDQNVERPRSWIGLLPHFTREMPNSKVNHGYRMPTPPQKQTYWVCLRYGYITVGTGDEPGKDVILVGQDPTPRGGIRFFGFGSWGKSVGWGDRGAKYADGFIENVSVCQITPDLPMPNEHVACRQNPALCPQKIPVPLGTLDIERYYKSSNYPGEYKAQSS